MRSARGSGGGYCFGGDRLNSTNAFGGGQFGYNWQGWGNFVVGLEVDLEGIAGGNERSFFGVTHPADAVGTPISATFKENGGFAGDVTGRLGYAWGNWMLYAKGGFAWFNPDISARATVFDGNGSTHRRYLGLRQQHDFNWLDRWRRRRMAA